ncbi:hypothetical protein TRSC58_07524 [Trypanosoma rangeli SC58]|uniref:Uncharacterized protein n=1 Tax=Trypanosoma rangeli SC58 TaxID=429131 RepID=A0A061IRK7_TRYRA|nr:hypothetical protein TRSC58_07524 [Trypanosoma rangeli SC58]
MGPPYSRHATSPLLASLKRGRKGGGNKRKVELTDWGGGGGGGVDAQMHTREGQGQRRCRREEAVLHAGLTPCAAYLWPLSALALPPVKYGRKDTKRPLRHPSAAEPESKKKKRKRCINGEADVRESTSWQRPASFQCEERACVACSCRSEAASPAAPSLLLSRQTRTGADTPMLA